MGRPVVAAAVLAAIALSLVLVHVLRRRTRQSGAPEGVQLFGAYSPVLTRIAARVPLRIPAALTGQPFGLGLGTGPLLAILVIALWSLWVGRKLLDFNEQVWPVGREFGLQIYGLHFWEQVKECGLCSLWNGMINGGSPFLADPFTGALHPIPALATLAAGVVNGGKLTILAALLLVGISQWWIGALLGLRLPSRLWTALVAVAGAHLTSHVEVGSAALPLSLAATSLALASGLALALQPSRGAALRFGVILSLAFLTGHGYYQVALLFWAPWLALIVATRKTSRGPVAREFALSAAIALLLAGIFLVPFLRFWPQAGKFTDPAFETTQPFEYIPLNLVIHDWDFLISAVLGKSPPIGLHSLFIGWPAVILAIMGVSLGRREDRQLLLFLSFGSLTMMWLASGVPFRWMASTIPLLTGFRHASIIAGLAVPAILGLAGYGLDRLLELNWPRLELGVSRGEAREVLSITSAWILLVPLAWNLYVEDRLDQSFLDTDSKVYLYEIIGGLSMEDRGWVSAPFGELYWIEPSLDSGMKLTGVASLWWWAGLEPPPPSLEAIRGGGGRVDTPVAHLGEVPVFANPDNHYSYVESADGIHPCRSRGTGGDILVRCESPGGLLVVQENAWAGWEAQIKGKGIPLEEGRWLSARIPSGPVEVRLRYRPADALVGLALTLTGVILVIALAVHSRRAPAADAGRS